MNKNELLKIVSMRILSFPDHYMDWIENFGIMMVLSYHPDDPSGGVMTVFNEDISMYGEDKKAMLLLSFIKELGFTDNERVNQFVSLLKDLR